MGLLQQTEFEVKFFAHIHYYYTTPDHSFDSSDVIDSAILRKTQPAEDYKNMPTKS